MKASINTVWCVAASVALLSAPAHASPALDAVRSCRKAVSKSGQVWAHKRRVLLSNCADKLVRCEVSSEVDGVNPGSCRSKAENSCKKTVGPGADTALTKAGVKFVGKVTAGCAAADFSTAVMANAAGGLWYSNDVDCGGAADLPALAACLRQAIAADVDRSIGTVSPRAGLLLDNAGLGVHFPDLPRPPTVEVLVTATALNSGTLVNPGTIPIASGEAVRFAGDATTLPCGMGNNGRVTVTALTFGASCGDTAEVLQEFSFKEPYGPSSTATVGPFEADVTYCLKLRDGSCQDEVSGTIDLP